MKMMDYNGGDCRWVCVAHTSQMMTPPRLDGVCMALMFQCRLNWRGDIGFSYIEGFLLSHSLCMQPDNSFI